MKTVKETQVTIDKSFNIFGAIRELFRDNILKPTDTFTVEFTDKFENKIKITNETGDAVFVSRDDVSTYAFEQLEIAIKNGASSLLDDLIDKVPRCEEASYEQLLFLAEEEEAYRAPTPICNNVFTVCKVGGISASLYELCIVRPECAATLGLFASFGFNERRAFTEDQALRHVVMSFASYYGVGITMLKNMENMEGHLNNVKEIYKHSYIIVEPIRQ